MRASEWYVKRDNRVDGPYSTEELRALVQAQRIGPSTKIREGLFGVWQRADSLSGLSTAPETSETGKSQTALMVAGSALFLLVASALVVVAFSSWEDAGPDDPIGWANADDDAAGERDSSPLPGEPSDDRPADPPAPTVAQKPREVPQPLAAVTPKPAPETDVPETVVPEPRSQPQPNSTTGRRSRMAPSPAAPQPKEASPSPSVAGTPPPAITPENSDDFAPLLPSVPETRVPIEDRDLSAFNKHVTTYRKAAAAYRAYQRFAESHDFTEYQKLTVDEQLALWKQRAEDQLVRLGRDWVSPATLNEAETKAQKAIERAVVQWQNRRGPDAVDSLEEASRVNPNDIRADYILGLLHSLPMGPKQNDKAEKYFRRVLVRDPNHPEALNSLAITLVKQREFAPALPLFEQSATLSQSPHEVAQNLGRLVHLVERGRISVPSATIKRYSALYEKLVSEQKASPFDRRVGWQHMIPVLPRSSNEDEPADSPLAPSDLKLWGQGSGFVIAPGFVLTNRHVVLDDERGLGLVDEVRAAREQNGESVELPGKIVGVSQTTDLALIHFPEMTLPQLPLRRDSVELASDIMIFGYPRADELGHGLKATRGTIAGLPDRTRRTGGELLLFDGEADHGSSGGPVLSQSGGVLAVLTAGFKLAYGSEETSLTGGIPSPVVIAFLQEHLPDAGALMIPDVEPMTKDWAEVARTASTSVLRLNAYRKAGLQGLNRVSNSSNVWTDNTCAVCGGLAWRNCPKRGCVNGVVSTRYFETIVTEARTRATIRIPKVRKDPCSGCNGEGKIDCPACENGIDGSLR